MLVPPAPAALAKGGPTPPTEPRPQLREEKQGGPMKTVWIYTNTNAEVGEADHLQVFAT
jgi:hypothetical protein